jgi:hypothetical protein
MARTIVAVDSAPLGIARIMCMAETVSRLFEVKRWYTEKGRASLLAIAERKGIKTNVESSLSAISKTTQIGRIDSYAKYRNKIGYHYDKDAITHLESFVTEPADPYHELLLAFLTYSRDWAKLVRDTIQASRA